MDYGSLSASRSCALSDLNGVGFDIPCPVRRVALSSWAVKAHFGWKL